MARDFNAVIAAEGQLSEAVKAPAMADALKSRLEGMEDILKRALVVVQSSTRKIEGSMV